MTCKGVYASLGFSIYITKEELLTLLGKTTVKGQAYIGKTRIPGGEVTININLVTLQILYKAYFQDKDAIETAKASMASGYFKSVNKIDKP